MEEQTRLYIVDDEKMAIEYFKRLAAEVSPACSVVGEALHGQTALEEIPRLKPDIVFIDVSMPVMNGLVLSEELLKQNPGQMIVLLTSYREFDYVKRGMELGVNQYLLKNELTVEKLGQEISRIAAEIRLQKQQQHTYLEYNMKRFLENESEDTDGLENIYKGSSLSRYALIAVCMLKPVCIGQAIEGHVRFDTMMLEELAYPEGISCKGTARMTEEFWVGAFFIEEQVPDSGGLLKEAANLMMEIFEKEGIYTYSVISNVTKKFLTLPQSYKKLVGLSRYMFCREQGKVYREEELRGRFAVQEIDSYQTAEHCIAKLVNSLAAREEQVSLELAEQIFNESRRVTIREFTQILLDLQGIIRRFGESVKVDANLILPKSEFISLEEAKEYIMSVIRHIFEYTNAREQSRYSRNVLNIMEFIQKHFQENISLQDIAEAVRLSEGHTRKCFKQETGITVVDYLTDYRIGRAKELMEAGEKITSIFEKVGFASSQYFSYVFKKKEGISPSEYARRLR